MLAAETVLGLFGVFFNLIYPMYFFSFSLSLGDDSLWTKILSQMACVPKTIDQLYSQNKKLSDLRKNICLRKSEAFIERIPVSNDSDNWQNIAHAPVPMTSSACYQSNEETIMISE